MVLRYENYLCQIPCICLADGTCLWLLLISVDMLEMNFICVGLAYLLEVFDENCRELLKHDWQHHEQICFYIFLVYRMKASVMCCSLKEIFLLELIFCHQISKTIDATWNDGSVLLNKFQLYSIKIVMQRVSEHTVFVQSLVWGLLWCWGMATHSWQCEWRYTGGWLMHHSMQRSI